MIEWKEWETPDGILNYETEYKGFHLLIVHDEKLYPYAYRDDERVELRPISPEKLEVAKGMLTRYADNASLTFKGKWHRYPDEEPEEDTSCIVSMRCFKNLNPRHYLAFYRHGMFFHDGLPFMND